MTTYGLIACSSKKQTGTHPAKDLYNSSLFQKSRVFAEQQCDDWFILSAKHGLLHPEEPTAAYEHTLNRMVVADRRAWAERVLAELKPILREGDCVLLLAGSRYRENLSAALRELEVEVIVPLRGLPIGRQLQWLASALRNSRVISDLERFYELLAELSQRQGGPSLGECSGHSDWPRRGVYFFFEDGEQRRLSAGSPRVTRVGTHAVSKGSRTTLWSRLRAHRGTLAGGGNHRGSVFRLSVGAALLRKFGATDQLPTWGKGGSAPAAVKDKERWLEQEVSKVMAAFRLAWVEVPDEPGPRSERAVIERNAIALLSSGAIPVDAASSGWLGLYSPKEEIRRSGIWNTDHVGSSYDPAFLSLLEHYVR